LIKHKVLTPFLDYETGEFYKVGQEIELTEVRSKELTENLKKRDGKFLETVKETKKDTPKK